MDKCKVCGRADRKIINNLCPRHKTQYDEFGEVQDMNALDEYDVNEINVINRRLFHYCKSIFIC